VEVRAESSVRFQPFVRAKRAVPLIPEKKNKNGNTLYVIINVKKKA